MAKQTILIVEDKSEFRKIYGDRLRFDGYDVKDAADGKEALKVLEENSVDLIITDINMPNMDGYELIQAVRANESTKDIPILVMSVFDQGEHVEKARALGATDYIVKGTRTPNAVTEKVKEILS